MSLKRRTRTGYHLAFDGLFRGLPGYTGPETKAGVMCYGWLIQKDGEIIARGHGAVARGSDATSNVAEYLALIEGLDALLDLGLKDEPVLISGDSKVVIDQMRGVSQVNAPSMKPLHRRAQRLVSYLTEYEWAWTPRKNNRLADALTRLAVKQMRLDMHEYQSTLWAINPSNQFRSQSKRFLPLIDLRVYHPANSLAAA